MKGLSKILLEGRVEDAQKYFENAVGSWPVAEPGNPLGIGVGTNLEGVLQHFVQNDPSGNNKYLMWMIKRYIDPEERGTPGRPHNDICTNSGEIPVRYGPRTPAGAI